MKKCPFCAEEVHNDAKVCKHCSRRVKTRLWPWLVGVGLVGLWLLSVAVDEAGRQARLSELVAQPTVMVIKHLDEVRFINESDVALADCTVVIDGGHEGLLRALEPKGRAFLMRAQFKSGNSRDEFHTRALRRFDMECATGGRVRVK